jgi:hypothetical protein
MLGPCPRPTQRTYPSSTAATRRRVIDVRIPPGHRPQPNEWSQALASTGSPSPYIGEVLDTAFNMARAIVVLTTPDEIAQVAQARQLWMGLAPRQAGTTAACSTGAHVKAKRRLEGCGSGFPDRAWKAKSDAPDL